METQVDTRTDDFPTATDPDEKQKQTLVFAMNCYKMLKKADIKAVRRHAKAPDTAAEARRVHKHSK